MVIKVLLTSPIPDDCMDRMKSLGWEITYIPKAKQEDVMKHIEGKDGVFINTKTLADKELISKGSNLKFIGRIGSGLDIVDLEEAHKNGIRVYNSPEGNRNAVAEHVIGMILAFANQLKDADRAVREKIWDREKYRGFEIAGTCIGIIGFGNTGKTLFQRLSGFDLDVFVYDPYVEAMGEGLTQVDTLDTIAEKCDIISYHVQLTSETKGMANLSFFDKCTRHPLIINTSRGSIVLLEDLIQALLMGLIRGACLDVFTNEKPETYTAEEAKLYNQLFNREDVLLSPHVAGWSSHSKTAIVNVLIDKVIADL